MAGIRFVLDEDVSHWLAGLLRSRGNNADSAKEMGRLRISDVQVLVQATAHGQAVITHNIKDFELLHEAWMTFRTRWTDEILSETGNSADFSMHAGILIVPQQSLEANVLLIAEFDDRFSDIDGRLYRWRAGSGWNRETG